MSNIQNKYTSPKMNDGALGGQKETPDPTPTGAETWYHY